MLRVSSQLIAVALLSIVFLVAPSTGDAAGLPEGVTVDVIAKYPSKTPGVKEILYRKITIKAGASWSLTVPAQSVCQGTKGILKVVNHTTGETQIFNAGDRWSTIPGHKVTLSAEGGAAHEHLFYTMVPKK